MFEGQYPRPHWQDNVEGTQWLDLLHPFITVKNLYLSSRLTIPVTFSLQGLAGERVLEVLPALRNLFFEAPQPFGPVQDAIQQFVADRQLSAHPVAVHRWDRGEMVDD